MCFEIIEPGDEVIAVDDLYGGTYRMFTRLLKISAEVHFYHFDDVSKLQM
ncbi:hypothetical protein EJ377_04340 [Chryseobacterium arthrosphaerae]|uniref:Cystathionine gamma-synthase n=1 Tax=Chryseobacterium arthrosphaerae TaxID=651561 RepID=A0A3S0Q8P4_9FLAO|nr:hypothetical protein EJ377_04340 [Chryseobacterium arthrosphaerae]